MHTTSYEFLAPCQNSEKSNDPIPKTLRQMAGEKDRQTLFHRTLWAIAEGPTSTAVVQWHLKVKDIECDVSLTTNYCITLSMQKISAIHIFIFKVQLILGSNEINGHAHF